MVSATDGTGRSRTMPNTDTELSTERRPRNWRNRENRASKKYIAKRVSEDDHELLTAYAGRLNMSVSELLAPAVQNLLDLARADQAKAS